MALFSWTGSAITPTSVVVSSASNMSIERGDAGLNLALLASNKITQRTKLDSRVVMQEEWFQKNQHLAEKVFRLEERLIAIHEEINELEARLNHVK